MRAICLVKAGAELTLSMESWTMFGLSFMAALGLQSSQLSSMSHQLPFFQLDFFSTSPASANAKQYEEELVRNHLRMLYSVHQNRQTIVTGTSPEPIIAEASARIMYHTFENGEPYMDLWSLLEKFVDRGLAAQGAIGELIGRALSISAMDHAIHGLQTVCELT